MPSINLEHTERAALWQIWRLHGIELDKLKQFLKDECAACFSVDEWPLAPDDFNVYLDQVDTTSDQKQDVILRVTLHHFAERVQQGDNNAQELATKISARLNTEALVEQRGYRLTVGVSLLFAEIAWATA